MISQKCECKDIKKLYSCKFFLIFFTQNLIFYVIYYNFAQVFANSIFKMLDKTLGIVLCSIPYNDNSQFVHIYTEKFGKITYKVAIKHYRKTAHQRMAFTPMSLLELDVEHSESSEVQKIKEVVVISSPLMTGTSDAVKYSQCLYLAELLDKSVREVEKNNQLWEYIYNSLEMLFLPEFSSDEFHLLFTANLFGHLGFGINYMEYAKGMQFDMKEGCFTNTPILHPYFLNKVSAEYLYRLLSTEFSDIQSLKLNRDERQTMLDILLIYLKIHIPELENVNFDILKDIL